MARDAAVSDLQLALERFERDVEAAQKAGLHDPDTRVALEKLRALAEMDSEIAGYLESAVGELPMDIRADMLNVATRFLTAQAATIDHVRSRVLMELP